MDIPLCSIFKRSQSDALQEKAFVVVHVHVHTHPITKRTNVRGQKLSGLIFRHFNAKISLINDLDRPGIDPASTRNRPIIE